MKISNESVTSNAIEIDTVDGRNPAPVDMVNIQLFSRFYMSQVVSRISSINCSCRV